MPPASNSGNHNLKIFLDDGPVFRPGDVISGHITRRSHLVSPNVRVSLNLKGRAKARIIVTRSNSGIAMATETSSTYRSRWNFFDAQQCPKTTLRIFDGPLHIPPPTLGEVEKNAATWPFTITIPKYTHMGPKTNTNPKYKPYIDMRKSTAGIEVLDPLPGSFTQLESQGVGRRRFDAYVEYWLEATLISSDSKKGVHETAVQLLTIRTLPSPHPLSPHMIQRNFHHEVKTQRLEPGMMDAKLSFRQSLAKTFRLSSVPSFSFKIEVQTPAQIRLNALPGETVPFMVRIVPTISSVKSEKKQIDEIPVVGLSILRMFIKSKTHVQARDGKYTGEETHGSRKSNLGIGLLSAPIELPVGQGVEPLDTGRLLGLRIGSETSMAQGREVKMEPKLTETFTTYCIKLTHSLIWELTVTVAKESKRFCGETEVELLAAP